MIEPKFFKAPKRPLPKVVGAPKNAFGTRRCQRVSCQKCHRVDYIAVTLKKTHEQMCRECAEKFLETYDHGRHIAEKVIKVFCDQCLREFQLNESLLLKKKPVLCGDCFRGFEVWRGKVGKSSPVRRTILTKAGSKTIFRKKNNEHA